ncbi:putative membrane protein [Burkholderia cepacia]|nr:putative membrane protein [Burkholderia cepacia]
MVALVTIPLAVGFLWRLALVFHWWTIAIFLIASGMVGVLNGIFARNVGRDFLYSAQPLQATIIVIATAACWIPTMIFE